MGYHKFSTHAKERLKERTRLKQKDIINVLKNNKFITIAVNLTQKRSHLLFFSLPEGRFFVIIQDFRGWIVTIVPYELTAKNICPPPEVIMAAMKKVMPEKQTTAIDTSEPNEGAKSR